MNRSGATRDMPGIIGADERIWSLKLWIPLFCVSSGDNMGRSLVRTAAGLLLIVVASPAHAAESASGLVAPGNFGFGAGVTPDPGLYVFSALARYDGDIRVYIDGGKTVIDVNKRPFLSG